MSTAEWFPERDQDLQRFRDQKNQVWVEGPSLGKEPQLREATSREFQGLGALRNFSFPDPSSFSSFPFAFFSLYVSSFSSSFSFFFFFFFFFPFLFPFLFRPLPKDFFPAATATRAATATECSGGRPRSPRRPRLDQALKNFPDLATFFTLFLNSFFSRCCLTRFFLSFSRSKASFPPSFLSQFAFGLRLSSRTASAWCCGWRTGCQCCKRRWQDFDFHNSDGWGPAGDGKSGSGMKQ